MKLADNDPQRKMVHRKPSTVGFRARAETKAAFAENDTARARFTWNFVLTEVLGEEAFPVNLIPWALATIRSICSSDY